MPCCFFPLIWGLFACVDGLRAQRGPALPKSAWPQGSGPTGNWRSEGAAPPLRFSVREGTHIRWRVKLPETGQGGIAVFGERAYVATMAPWDPVNAISKEEAARYAHAIERRKVTGKHIDAHCVDVASGEILWTRRVEGIVPAIYTYPFSDATSASPVTDGEHVWFTNASGRLVCFDREGQIVWERTWTPAFDGPFNKQFEPFLVGAGGERPVLVHMEPFPAPDAKDPKSARGRWHYLLGVDAATGEVLWRSEDALPYYNAPTLVRRGGEVFALIARGGPHKVPERPVGVSLVRVSGARAGTSVWRFADPRGNHEASLQTMASDAKFAYWILKKPRNALVVLDLESGRELDSIALDKDVTRTSFDTERRSWRTERDVTLAKGVFPARYSMIAARGRVFFQCYATAWGKPTLDPPYSFGCVDIKRRAVSYLEVPTDVERDEDGREHFLWRTKRVARPVNGRGLEVTGDKRSRWDGWDWVFNGSPTRVNDRLYFTLASGVVYVLDAAARVFDGSALLALCDLGPAGGVWTANSVSYADGSLFHRTGAELIRIGY